MKSKKSSQTTKEKNKKKEDKNQGQQQQQQQQQQELIKDAGLVLTENSKSVAGAPLPELLLDPKKKNSQGTILLFYQYKEPAWTSNEHKQVLKDVIALGTKCGITGRGRIAPEGLNCTLSGPPLAIRAFCQGLRDYNPLFLETDFKLTDGVDMDKMFKSLSIRKTKELVAYGLAGHDKAPSLEDFRGQHLNADAYHQAMQDPNAVVIDVRNAYESAIGNFQPPPGGAQFLDPQMRNSIEFPKWLADERTQKKLHGKKVLMYCTGGIRCERATALLNQMSTVHPDTLKPQGVYELQGGIERYIKTFPQGGYWKGKNYLFDRRLEQTPEQKSSQAVEQDINSSHAKCVMCRQKWTSYRGKFKCSHGLCGVPVMVCDACRPKAISTPPQQLKLQCELCRVGYKAPQLMPDLVGMKRKAQQVVNDTNNSNGTTTTPEGDSKRIKSKHDENDDHLKKQPETTSSVATTKTDRLFLSRLPLTATKTKIFEALFGNNNDDDDDFDVHSSKMKLLHWLTDSKTGAFYGSCIVQVASVDVAETIMSHASTSNLKVDKKKIKIGWYHPKKTESWPPPNWKDREYPPIGR